MPSRGPAGPPHPTGDAGRRIVRVTLDERTVVRRSPEVEHERAVAIFDLIEENFFSPVDDEGGPYSLYLGIEECFQKNVAVPFESPEAGRRMLAACAQMELGRLHAQGGAAMAEKGRAVLGQIGLLK